MKSSSGIRQTAKKVVIYGPEGIGKSTFASHFPSPIFLDTEGSTKTMDVARYEDFSDWYELIGLVNGLCSSTQYKTIIVDTADWAEMLAIDYVCKSKKVKGIEDIGYGKGYTFVQEEFKVLLNALEGCVKTGHNVVLTAHAKMRKFEQPDEAGAYDRWEMKLSKQVAPMVKEWADMVLFANYKTFAVKDENGKAKAQGGKRTMYTQHHPCWDAKNRFGLPEEVAFDYESIRSLIESTRSTEEMKNTTSDAPESSESAPKAESEELTKLRELIAQSGLTEKQVIDTIAFKTNSAECGFYENGARLESLSPVFIKVNLLDKWSGFSKVAKLTSDGESSPFQ